MMPREWRHRQLSVLLGKSVTTNARLVRGPPPSLHEPVSIVPVAPSRAQSAAPWRYQSFVAFDQSSPSFAILTWSFVHHHAPSSSHMGWFG